MHSNEARLAACAAPGLTRARARTLKQRPAPFETTPEGRPAVQFVKDAAIAPLQE